MQVVRKIDALTALVKDCRFVITHLESIVAADEGCVTAVAKVLKRKQEDFKSVHVIHFLLDCLYIWESVSLAFQKQVILIFTVQMHVQITVTALCTL